jgi:outer membrane protein insertion porin family
VLAVGALCAVALPAAAQDSLMQRPLIKGLSFRGNRALDDHALGISIVTTNSSWWVRSPLVSWIGMGQRRYFDEREFRRDLLRLKLLYSQVGYPDAAIDTTVQRNDGEVRLAFHIVEGLPVRVTELAVSGVEGIMDSAALRRQLPLEHGAPFNRLLFGAATDSIRAALQDRGYPFADVFRGFAVDREAREAAVSFDVDPGPQAAWGPVEIQGADRVTEGAIARMVPMRSGRRYRRSDLLDAQRDLYASGAFDYVDVRLADSAGPGATDSTVRALIRVREGSFYRVRAAPGYGTQDCFRALLGLSAANAWGNLRRFDVTARFSKIGTGDPFGWGLENSLCRALQDDDPERRALNYNVSASMSDPGLFGRTVGGALSVFAERRSEIEAYVREGFGVEASLTFRVMRATPVTVSYELGRATTKASPASTCFYLNVCRADDIAAYQQPRREAILGLVALRNRQNSVLNPTRGSFASAEIRWGSPLIGADSLSAFTKLQGQYAQYHRIGRGAVLSWRVAAGTLLSSGVGVEGEQRFYVPPEQRFYAGGATTVRGFGQNELGPVVRVIDSVPENGGVRVDTLSSASGGTDQLLANLELRLPVPGFGGRVEGALFVDAGQVFDRQDGSMDQPGVRITPGVGVRFITGVGPIRFDVGYNGYRPRAGPLYVEQANGDLTPDPTNPTYAPDRPSSLLNRLRLHFSVGQAF